MNTLDNAKMPSLIYDTVIIQGYESVKKGNVSTANIMPNVGAIIVHNMLLKSWLDVRVPKWFNMKEQEYNDWVSNTLGLTGGFLITDKLLDEPGGFKSSLVKAALVSTVKTIVGSFSPDKKA